MDFAPKRVFFIGVELTYKKCKGSKLDIDTNLIEIYLNGIKEEFNEFNDENGRLVKHLLIEGQNSNAPPTKKNILEKLTEVARKSKSDDLIIFCYSGRIKDHKNNVNPNNWHYTLQSLKVTNRYFGEEHNIDEIRYSEMLPIFAKLANKETRMLIIIHDHSPENTYKGKLLASSFRANSRYTPLPPTRKKRTREGNNHNSDCSNPRAPDNTYYNKTYMPHIQKPITNYQTCYSDPTTPDTICDNVITLTNNNAKQGVDNTAALALIIKNVGIVKFISAVTDNASLLKLLGEICPVFFEEQEGGEEVKDANSARSDSEEIKYLLKEVKQSATNLGEAITQMFNKTGKAQRKCSTFKSTLTKSARPIKKLKID